MKIASFLKSLRQDRSGAAGILVGASLTALSGAAAVAIDLGSLYLAERRLQGVADAAALAAASGDIARDGRTLAEAVIFKAQIRDVTIEEMTPGVYAQDKSVAFGARFTSGSSDPSAAHVVLEQSVPLIFGALVTDSDSAVVRAQATASRIDLAAFSLGTKLLEFSGGIGNSLLSQLAGTELNLSVMDGRSLVNADIDILNFASAVKTGIGGTDQTFAEVFDSEIPLNTIVDAIAAATTNSATAELLRTISARLGGSGLRLSDIIDLGPAGEDSVSDGDSDIVVDAYSLLRSVLELAKGDTYEIDLTTSAAGLARTRLTLVGGGGIRTSPWLTITSARDYVLRTSQSRILIETQLGTGGLGNPLVNLPLYVELAEAEARLSDINCTGDDDTDGVTLQVTPSVGTVAIASVNRAKLSDLSTAMTLSPATLANVVVARVNAFSEIDLGGSQPQTVRFTQDDVTNRVTKTVSTNDIAQAIASSLVSDMDLQVQTLGLSLGSGALLSQVGNLVAGVAPAIDAILYETTQALGVKLGAADVRVDKVRCGIPSIVA